ALGWWRGPAYAGLDEPWAVAARTRLDQLRLHAIERRAGAPPGPRDPAAAGPGPRRPPGGRPAGGGGGGGGAPAPVPPGAPRGEALAVRREARGLLADQLGIDPGPRLLRLETDILRQTTPPGAEPDRPAPPGAAPPGAAPPGAAPPGAAPPGGALEGASDGGE